MNCKPNNITHTLWLDDGSRINITDLEIKLLGIIKLLKFSDETCSYGLLIPRSRFTI